MDFLEFLKFSKEDKHSSIILLMKIVISSLLTILIYRHLDGQVFIPKEITLSIILNFIFSYEILIPIVSVSIFILIITVENKILPLSKELRKDLLDRLRMV
ncbi:MAG: hypothetical protein RLZZ306_1982 [Bacteroidota bacterium]|jgi:hypothetical protein